MGLDHTGIAQYIRLRICIVRCEMITKTANPRLDTIFRALSDLTRLRIVNLLRRGELCVCDLVNVLDVPQPTVSRHLGYLRRAGLVQARKEGLWHYYRLAPCRSVFHERLMQCLAVSEAQAPELKADTKRLRSAGRRDCCD